MNKKVKQIEALLQAETFKPAEIIHIYRKLDEFEANSSRYTDYAKSNLTKLVCSLCVDEFRQFMSVIQDSIDMANDKEADLLSDIIDVMLKSKREYIDIVKYTRDVYVDYQLVKDLEVLQRKIWVKRHYT